MTQHRHRMGLNSFSASVLNFHGEVDGNVKCEQSINMKVCLHLMFAFTSTSLSKFNIASIVMQTQTQTQNRSELILCVNVKL